MRVSRAVVMCLAVLLVSMSWALAACTGELASESETLQRLMRRKR